MTSLLSVTLEEWPNGWSYKIYGYMDSESGVCVTFKQAMRKIASYQARAYKAYMRDNPTAKIAR